MSPTSYLTALPHNVVTPTGLEPVTPALKVPCAANCATEPYDRPRVFEAGNYKRFCFIKVIMVQI